MTVVQLMTDNREPFRQYDRPRPWFGAATTALLQGFSECPDVAVHVVTCTQRPMKSSPTKLAANIWFHSLHVPKWGWLRSGYLGCIRASRVRIRTLKPDIVHGQGTERDCAVCAISSGYPNVVTIHGNMVALASLFHAPVGSFYWLTARLENFTLKRTNGVFCNSEYTEDLVRNRAQRPWRVPNAVRKEFCSEVPMRKSSNPKIVLNVGVISARKRQRELLACARRLHLGGSHLRWDFYGQADANDEYARGFLAEIKEAEAAGYARYLGTRSTGDIVQCFDEASALVHFPTEEAFGLVVTEALARNLKFFGSKLGGIQGIAADVEGAELFASDDWTGLEQAILRWEAGGFILPQTAAQKMRELYAPRVVANRHLQIYREL